MISHGWISGPRFCLPMLVFGALSCGGSGGANTEAPPQGVIAPTITAHPQNRTVATGQTATFSVAAEGTSPFAYQWKKNGTAIGVDAANYTTPATTLTDNNAKFTVTVTNAAGHSDSTEATLTVNLNTGSAIIVNHTHTNLVQVPSASITAAKNTLKIAYGHSSHGSQLITGMIALAGNGSPYSFNNHGAGTPLIIYDGAMAGDVGYYPDWVNNTRSYLGTPNGSTGRGSNHGDVNVVLWSWCGQASGRTQQDMIDTYLAPMTQLEADYPGVNFVYMTGHLDGGGTSGNLNQRNEQIRAYCLANNKILFDFADIESYDPIGSVNFMALNGDDGCNYDGGGSRRNWASDWLGSHSGDPLATLAASCGGCAHSETLNCVQKGRAAWWLWARLAGWNGQ